MEIKMLLYAEQEEYYEEILGMLKAADNEFVPPLSARNSTTQKNLTDTKSTPDGIQMYFEEMKKQRFAVALDEGRLIAFMSFRENYTTDVIKDIPNVYLSTLIVKPEGRGRRVTQTMYEKLFEAYPESSVFTRTWSTNVAHTKILSCLGFENFKTIENDRGEGIDTVYFVKHRC